MVPVMLPLPPTMTMIRKSMDLRKSKFEGCRKE
jgi:hypothetical protein